MILTPLTQIFHKDHRPLPIRGIGRNNVNRSRNRVDCAIIGLSFTEIGHWNVNPLTPWPPHIPTRSIPDQMAFIDIQHDNGSFHNRGRT